MGFVVGGCGRGEGDGDEIVKGKLVGDRDTLLVVQRKSLI